MTYKDSHRQKHADIVLYLVIFLAVSTVGLAVAELVTAAFVAALTTIMGYAGNHTYQNYRTSPEEPENENIR